jgi:hypothetical protein
MGGRSSGTGLTAIISALVALVSVFIYGKSKQKKELKEKSEPLTKIGTADQPTAQV